jgi:MAST domain-containing protein
MKIKMKMKSLDLSVLCVLLIVVLGSLPALAQMGQGGNVNGMGQGGNVNSMGQGMGPGTGQGMMNGYGFDQYDSRFAGFGSMTFGEVCNNFGVPVETALSDLNLPKNMDTSLTILEVEEQYGVTGQEIANYMVTNMRQMPASLNARQQLLMRQQAIQNMRGMGQGMYFMRQGRFAYGNYTTFSFDTDTGEISNFSVSGDQIFDSITVSDFAFKEEQVAGAAAIYYGENSRILLHDNPMGTMQVMAFANKTVVFNLSEGVEANVNTELSNELGNAIIVNITKDNFEGSLIVFKNYLATATGEEPLEGLDAQVSGDKVTVTLVNNSVVVFRANPMDPALMQTGYNYGSHVAYMNQVLDREIARGMVGAEIAMRAGGNNSSIVNYTPMGLQIKERDRDRIVLGVESNISQGRVITVTVDNETINLTNPDRLRLHIDGNAIERAANIDELFAGGTRPLCYLVQENETATMAVYIPQFSEHEIVIDLEPEAGEETTGEETGEETGEGTTETEATPTPAFEFGLGIAVLASAYGLKRRR